MHASDNLLRDFVIRKSLVSCVACAQHDRYYYIITNWTTTSSILVCFKNFELIQGKNNILKLSVYSDCSHGGGFKLKCTSCTIITWHSDTFNYHILDRNSINSCLFWDFRVDPSPQKHALTDGQLRMFESWWLKIPFSSRIITILHSDSFSLPHIGP